MRISIPVVLSVITAPHNAHTPHISKNYLPIVSLNVHELKFDVQKTSQGKREASLPRGESPTPPE